MAEKQPKQAPAPRASLAQDGSSNAQKIVPENLAQTPAVFVGSEIYRQPSFGQNHPLAISRIATVMDLCETMGWFGGNVFQHSTEASIDTLEMFHDRAYIDAIRSADTTGRVTRAMREKYRIGTMENPLFPGVFKRAASTVGGSILAAELSLAGIVAFHPSGGTHHGRPDHANGFCYFNDPVFAILTMLEQGVDRVLYVDLDAHHGDGVQDAFASNSRVFTISIHENGRWPYSGAINDRGQGRARNFPVPKGFNDTELEFIMDEAVLPLVHRFAATALVITCGADALHDDPLSGLSLSNSGLWAAVEKLTHMADYAVVLGGGGYNPWSTARCWSGLWARLAGRPIPESLPKQAEDILKKLECDLVDDDEQCDSWTSTIADPPRTGTLREQVCQTIATILAD